MVFRAALTGLVLLVACGAPSSQQDSGTGFGGGFASFGGGFTTGGGVASGGGAATGGGAAGGAAQGGGSATGGGAATGGGGALTPLQWSSMTLSGAPSSFTSIIALGGVSGDVWALQENGALYRSTGAAFTYLFSFQNGGKGLFVSGSTVVVLQTRRILTCTADCHLQANYAQLDLLNTLLNWNLFGEAVCGRSPTEITVAVSDTTDDGQLLQWNGTTWVRTAISIGLSSPRDCWYDDGGALFLVGEGAVVHHEQAASTPEPLTGQPLTIYYGGGVVAGTHYVVGPAGYIAKRGPGRTWTQATVPVSSPSTLYVVGGLAPNEVFAFGYYHSTSGNGFKWDGAQWRNAGNLLPGFDSQSTVRAMLVAGPNELFVGGASSSSPLVVRGRR